MPEGTQFIRPSNELVRELVRERIADGRWRVNAEAGIVYGCNGQPLRGKRDSDGYQQFTIRVSRRMQLVASGHRVIWESVHGPIPWPMQVNHLNGVKDDNRLANLELLTPSDNVRHAHRTGLNPRPRGEEHGKARLNEDQVREIRRMLCQGATMRECAERFGMSIPGISSIKQRRAWAHVA